MHAKPRPRRRGPRFAPKRVMSAYMFYVKEFRPKLLREQPGMSFIDIMRKVGSDWRNLREADKANYT